jgi:hypothetical protein
MPGFIKAHVDFDGSLETTNLLPESGNPQFHGLGAPFLMLSRVIVW